MKLYIALICLFVLSVSSLLASPPAAVNASISGYVRDKQSKETLVAATVFLKDSRYGTRTNKTGFYSLSDLPAGDYTVSVSFLGYERLELKISLKKGESVRKDFELKTSNITTDDVVVEAEREVDKRQISISNISIPVANIKQIRVGGESDVFRSLQFLPGVLTSSQISSGLFVRGGSPDQNLVLLDGSTVYNPTHLFGFISTFNTDAIKDVELIKGGFEAEYGGRMSAVLNITQKDGDRSRVGGIASIGAISSRAALEGPIGNGSWFIGGRRTYFELIKSLLETDPEDPIPDFNFYDLNGKITQDFGDNDKVSLSGFMSQDALDISTFGVTFGLEIGNRLAAMKWTHIFSSTLFATLNLSGSHYFNNFVGDQSGYQFLIENSVTDYSAKMSFEWFTSERITHKFGVEYNNYNFSYLQNFTGDTDSTDVGSSAGTTNLDIIDNNWAFYGQVNYNPIELFSIQAGLRANYWDLRNVFLIDPRFAVRYQLFDNIALKGAWGIFSQNLRLATQPDFSFFDTWLPTDSTINPGRSMHYIFSIETKPYKNIDLNFDVYYKDFRNVSELNQTALSREKGTVSDVFYIGSAHSYGAEVFLQKKSGRLTGWVGYALGFIRSQFDSINGGREFRPKYDRLHDFKVVAQYNLNERWDLGASFTFQSGQSYTGATSRVQSFLPHQSFGRGKIVPSQRYGLRLPPSHQLNLNASYSFKTFGFDSKAIIDIYNVYNRRDIWFRYYNISELETKVEDVRLIPILPTISYEIKF